MVASIAAILTNLLFNYLLIYGKFRFRLRPPAALQFCYACLELAILLIVPGKLPNAAPLRFLRFTWPGCCSQGSRPTTLNECLRVGVRCCIPATG